METHAARVTDRQKLPIERMRQILPIGRFCRFYPSPPLSCSQPCALVLGGRRKGGDCAHIKKLGDVYKIKQALLFGSGGRACVAAGWERNRRPARATPWWSPAPPLLPCVLSKNSACPRPGCAPPCPGGNRAELAGLLVRGNLNFWGKYNRRYSHSNRHPIS